MLVKKDRDNPSMLVRMQGDGWKTVQPVREALPQLLMKLNLQMLHSQAVLLLGIYTREVKTRVHKEIIQ